MTRTEQKKLKLLRRWNPAIPNIYNVIDFEPNGCSSVPDWYIGFWPGVACDYHDYLYWLGGTEADRLAADDVFLEIMNWLIDHGWWCNTFKYFRVRSRILAAGYHAAVVECGGPHFRYIKDTLDTSDISDIPND